MSEETFEIINYYVFFNKPISGIAKNKDKYYWYRIIDSDIIENPEDMNVYKHDEEINEKISLDEKEINEKISLDKKEINEKIFLDEDSEDDSDSSEFSFSDLTLVEDENEENDIDYKYSLFEISNENLELCFKEFENIEKNKKNRENPVRRYEHSTNLESLFSGDFILINSSQFSNYYQPRLINNV